jgi:hypothetical protein
MARFTVQVCVLACLLRFKNVRMAGLASFMPGKVDGAGSDLAHRVCAVMTVLSEALGDYEVTYHQECEERDHKEKRKPKKMSCILQKAHRINFLPDTLSPLSRSKGEAKPYLE